MVRQQLCQGLHQGDLVLLVVDAADTEDDPALGWNALGLSKGGAVTAGEGHAVHPVRHQLHALPRQALAGGGKLVAADAEHGIGVLQHPARAHGHAEQPAPLQPALDGCQHLAHLALRHHEMAAVQGDDIGDAAELRCRAHGGPQALAAVGMQQVHPGLPQQRPEQRQRQQIAALLVHVAPRRFVEPQEGIAVREAPNGHAADGLRAGVRQRQAGEDADLVTAGQQRPAGLQDGGLGAAPLIGDEAPWNLNDLHRCHRFMRWLMRWAGPPPGGASALRQ